MRRTVLVTGGSGGIGGQIVRLLCNEGYRVIFTFNASEADAHRLVADIMADQPAAQVTAVHCPLLDRERIAAVVNALIAPGEGIYGFVHAAGVSYDQLAAMVDLDQAERLFQVNVLSMIQIIKSTLPVMMSGRMGRIVGVSSIAAAFGRRGNSIYSASKAAMEGFLRCLADEVRDRGVTVNWVRPGFIDTEMLRPYPGLGAQISRRTPLKRAGDPAEVAGCVRYLLSPEGAYTHGSAITVDGGVSATLGIT